MLSTDEVTELEAQIFGLLRNTFSKAAKPVPGVDYAAWAAHHTTLPEKTLEEMEKGAAEYADAFFQRTRPENRSYAYYEDEADARQTFHRGYYKFLSGRCRITPSSPEAIEMDGVLRDIHLHGTLLAKLREHYGQAAEQKGSIPEMTSQDFCIHTGAQAEKEFAKVPAEERSYRFYQNDRVILRAFSETCVELLSSQVSMVPTPPPTQQQGQTQSADLA